MNVPLSLAVGLCLLLAACGGSGGPAAPVQAFLPVTTSFHQVDFADMAGFTQLDSVSGAAVAAFDAPEGLLWLNVVTAANGQTQWQQQNLPVMSSGGPQEIVVPLDLTPMQIEAGGPDVTSIQAACTLSTLPLEAQPDGFVPSPVDAFEVNYDTGIAGTVIVPPTQPPVPWTFEYMGKSISIVAGFHTGYVNQECGVGECGPASISNSLKLIGAGTSSTNDIATTKGLTDWNPTTKKCPGNWADAKKAKTTGDPYNVDTEICTPSQDEAGNVRDFCDVVDAVRAGKDVEVENDHHVAMVVAAFKITVDGVTTYHLQVAHDVNQGKPGGTIVETIQYHPSTNTFTGGTQGFFPNTSRKQFVTEAKD